MPWGRLDDGANDNPKLRLLTDPAWRLWGCGLIYCQRYLTDGFIPAGMIDEFGVKAKNRQTLATELCAVLVPGKGPLWHVVEHGYRVHDYLDWNDSASDVRAGRERSRERFERHKQRRGKRVVNAVVNALLTPFQTVLATRSQHLSTYHVPRTDEKQERASASARAVEKLREQIRAHRRTRSSETADGYPAITVIAALARDVVARHPGETDDGELRERLKSACAKANLHYDGASVNVALDRALAQRRNGVR